MAALRRAVVGDAPDIARLYIDSWNLGFGHLIGMRTPSHARVVRWERDLKDPRTEWVVAEHHDAVVGFVGIGPSRDPVDPAVGELYAIGVDPARWRQGIGRLLMGEALDRLRRRFSSAVLWTVAGYDRGQRFYGAMGWAPLGLERAAGAEVAFGHDLL